MPWCKYGIDLRRLLALGYWTEINVDISRPTKREYETRRTVTLECDTLGKRFSRELELKWLEGGWRLFKGGVYSRAVFKLLTWNCTT